jgi:hypothetical protein
MHVYLGVLYSNAFVQVLYFCSYFPCRIDETDSGEEWPAGGILVDFLVFYIFIFISCVLSKKLCHGFFDGTSCNIQQLLHNICTSVVISHV